jgi:hypothetical protein
MKTFILALMLALGAAAVGDPAAAGGGGGIHLGYGR